MNETLLIRGARVLSWLAGAAAAGVAWYAVTVYGLGLFDQAYGPLFIFQVGTALAFGLAVLGLIGYAAAIAVYGSRQSWLVAVAAGALFTLVMQCISFGLGYLLPTGVPGLLALLLAVAIGGATSTMGRRA
jgi:hypothetical protein